MENYLKKSVADLFRYYLFGFIEFSTSYKRDNGTGLVKLTFFSISVVISF